MHDVLPAVLSRFATAGTRVRACRIDTGHINDTYRVETKGGEAEGEYVLQRINTAIFPDVAGLMENIAAVTDWIGTKLAAQGAADRDRRVLRIVPTMENDLFATDAQGGCWRVYHFIRDSHPLDAAPTLEEIRQAGLGFGTFLSQLADLPSERVSESIPHFHDGSRRYSAFVAAVAADAVERVAEVGAEIEFILRHEGLLAQPRKLIATGELPLRITHNDTKCNNILLDDRTGKSLCVIDLDLVMPGLALYDLGDLVRTSCTGVAEDEPDLSRIAVGEEPLRAAVEGFLEGARHLLTDRELESLPLGPPYMALIMATRFLTDYLAGDVYYRIHHQDHNLQRARAQIALTEQLLACRPLIDQLVLSPRT